MNDPGPRLASRQLPDVADTWLTRWEQEARQDPRLQRTTATVLLSQGRFAPAVDAFDRLLVRQPENAVAMRGKALALAGLGRHEDALPLFERAAEHEPDDAAAQFSLAVALMRAGEREEAAQALDIVLRLQPDHQRARFNAAILHQAAGRREQAIALWRLITEESNRVTSTSRPSHAANPQAEPPHRSDSTTRPDPAASMLTDAWFHRGELALDLSEPAEAETCFMKVVDVHPEDSQAWCNLGIARAAQIKRDDAVAALTEALRLNPRLVPAINQIAFIQAANFRDTGNPTYGEAVVELCRRSLGILPDQPNLRSLLHAIGVDESNSPPSEETDDER